MGPGSITHLHTHHLERCTNTGVLIDGVMLTIDNIERNTAGDTVWAAPLFTVRGSTDTIWFPGLCIVHACGGYFSRI